MQISQFSQIPDLFQKPLRGTNNTALTLKPDLHDWIYIQKRLK